MSLPEKPPLRGVPGPLKFDIGPPWRVLDPNYSGPLRLFFEANLPEILRSARRALMSEPSGNAEDDA